MRLALLVERLARLAGALASGFRSAAAAVAPRPWRDRRLVPLRVASREPGRRTGGPRRLGG
jgi:hypothetical protein